MMNRSSGGCSSLHTVDNAVLSGQLGQLRFCPRLIFYFVVDFSVNANSLGMCFMQGVAATGVSECR